MLRSLNFKSATSSLLLRMLPETSALAPLSSCETIWICSIVVPNFAPVSVRDNRVESLAEFALGSRVEFGPVFFQGIARHSDQVEMPLKHVPAFAAFCAQGHF